MSLIYIPEPDPAAAQLRRMRHGDIARDEAAGLQLYRAEPGLYTVRYLDCDCWLDIPASDDESAVARANAAVQAGRLKHRQSMHQERDLAKKARANERDQGGDGGGDHE